MSMFEVTGQVMKSYHQPGSVDPETGELTKGKDKVQILGEIPVSDGSTKYDLITLSVPEGVDFKPLMKKVVRVPLGFFAPSKNNIIYFIPKGSNVVSVPSSA